MSGILESSSVGRLLTEGGSFWLPPSGSTVAPGVDKIFYTIFWISVFFFALIVVLGSYFVFRYRRRKGGAIHGEGPTHNTPLEITWTVVPLIIVIGIFYFGFKGFLDMSVAPLNSYQVQVTAQKWKWLFTYPNGYVDENLHVPVDTPITLVMQSQDVIHSFYVPDFRIKRDVVPGRYNKTWFRATTPGNHQIYCAEYCGTSHSDMLATVIVHEPGGFEKWMDDAANFLAKMPPAEAGALLFKQRGCTQCHSVDGSPLVGPTLKDVFGTQVSLKDGTRVLADENYFRESILLPQAKIVAGYDPVMPTYQGRIKDPEIDAIIMYMKTVSASGGLAPAGAETPQPGSTAPQSTPTTNPQTGAH